MVPARGGDFNLSAHGKDAGKSILTVNAPTSKELEVLAGFLAAARGKGWVSQTAGIADAGETRLEVGAPVSEAGPLLVGDATRSDRGVLSVVRSKGGEIVGLADDELGKEAAAEATAAASAAPQADTAVTVRRGTVCCPHPVRGPLARASACLRAFCTPAQWATWVAHGFLDVVGGLTGTRYRVFHRHHPTAIALGQSVYDLDARRSVFRWDYRVPAPEEALGAALVLAFREHWLRNPSGAHMHREHLYANPFGAQRTDGRWDAMVFTGLATVADELVDVLRGGRPGLMLSILLHRVGGASEMDAVVEASQDHGILPENNWI